MGKDFLSDHQVVALFYPVADAFVGGLTSDAICLRDYRRITFFVMTGAIEDADVSNIVTIEACTAAAGTGHTAMEYHHRVCRSSTSVDTWGALTASASTGYNFSDNNAVANAMWAIEVTADEVQAAVANADFVRMAVAETEDKTITAAGFAILSEPRYPGAVPLTAIA